MAAPAGFGMVHRVMAFGDQYPCFAGPRHADGAVAILGGIKRRETRPIEHETAGIDPAINHLGRLGEWPKTSIAGKS
jgi:hypothetical protein